MTKNEKLIMNMVAFNWTYCMANYERMDGLYEFLSGVWTSINFSMPPCKEQTELLADISTLKMIALDNI